jgi:hypothetical protein
MAFSGLDGAHGCGADDDGCTIYNDATSLLVPHCGMLEIEESQWVDMMYAAALSVSCDMCYQPNSSVSSFKPK